MFVSASRVHSLAPLGNARDPRHRGGKRDAAEARRPTAGDRQNAWRASLFWCSQARPRGWSQSPTTVASRRTRRHAKLHAVTPPSRRRPSARIHPRDSQMHGAVPTRLPTRPRSRTNTSQALMELESAHLLAMPPAGELCAQYRVRATVRRPLPRAHVAHVAHDPARVFLCYFFWRSRGLHRRCTRQIYTCGAGFRRQY